jgi:Sulfotransferase family
MSGTAIDFPHPVFIGGFGRSGTHAIGPLVGADPRYHLVETEVRFHAVDGGLPDLLEGRIPMRRFLRAFWREWWERGFKRPQGVHRIVERDEMEAALEEFEAGFEEDRWEAGRRLLHRVIDPCAERAGKPAWVELTGRSVVYAPTLIRLFPEVRFINIVRDGRAIAGGHVKKIDMPDDPMVALVRWERMIRASDAGISAVSKERVLQIQLDDLVDRDREGTFARIVDFLRIDDPEPMRRYFERRITARKAHVGQWRERMPPPDARRIDRRYRRMVRKLHRDGIGWVPEPEPRRRPLGFGGERTAGRA